jgi:hypothetical protein
MKFELVRDTNRTIEFSHPTPTALQFILQILHQPIRNGLIHPIRQFPCPHNSFMISQGRIDHDQKGLFTNIYRSFKIQRDSQSFMTHYIFHGASSPTRDTDRDEFPLDGADDSGSSMLPSTASTLGGGSIVVGVGAAILALTLLLPTPTPPPPPP